MLSAAKCRPMILVARNIKYMQIFVGVPLEHEFCGCRAWRIYTRHMSLQAAS